MIVCSCHAVNQAKILQQLPNLNPVLPRADLNLKTRAGTDCGACQPDLRNIMAQNEIFTADISRTKSVHAMDRNIVFYSDLDDDLISSFAFAQQHSHRFYSVVGLSGIIEDVHRAAPQLGEMKLFALALEQGRQLYLNESGLPAEEWLATLSEDDAFQPWRQINQGLFRKWNPKKIDQKALLRFLVSEIAFVRDVLGVPPLQAMLTAASSQSRLSSFPHKYADIPNYQILIKKDSVPETLSENTGSQLLVLSAEELADGIDRHVQSILG